LSGERQENGAPGKEICFTFRSKKIFELLFKIFPPCRLKAKSAGDLIFQVTSGGGKITRIKKGENK
jgi:hypothetical protein